MHFTAYHAEQLGTAGAAGDSRRSWGQQAQLGTAHAGDRRQQLHICSQALRCQMRISVCSTSTPKFDIKLKRWNQRTGNYTSLANQEAGQLNTNTA